MQTAAFILGIWSVIACAKTKSKQIPLVLKLLVCSLVVLFLCGLMGTVTGTVDTFRNMGSSTGAAKALAMAVSISNALYSLFFSLFGCFEYLFFLAISAIVLHFRQKKLIDAP